MCTQISYRDFVFFLAVATVLLSGMLHFRELDPDLFARLAVGRLIVLDGTIPKVDPFAFTPVKSTWYDHEWLAGLVFYQVVAYVGQSGLLLLNLCFALLTVACLRLAQCDIEPRSTNKHWAWLTLSLFLGASIWTSPVRSHIFTYLGLSTTFLVWEVAWRRSDGRLLILLPPLYLVWGNAHGGIVTGLAFLLVASACTVYHKPQVSLWGIFSALACVASLLINPYGHGFLSFLVEAVFKQRTLITEWWPPQLLHPRSCLLWLHLGVAFFAVFARSSRVPLHGRAYLLLSAYQALRHERLVPVFAITSAVYSLPAFLQLTERLSLRWPARYAAWGVSGSIAAAGLVLTSASYALLTLLSTPSWGYAARSYPTQAIAWLKQNFNGGNVLIGFNQGSFALWRLPTSFKVSIDGRYEEVYEEETFLRAYTAYQIGYPGQQEALREINPDFVVYSVGTAEERLTDQLRDSHYLSYSDAAYGILARKELAPLIDAASPESLESPLSPGF